MKEDNQKQFVCECRKSFDTQIKLSHHKTCCKVFQANKKQREIEERESRRLPNGLFKCDNPDCTNEHDGSYGNGKFCCKACAAHVRSLNSAKSAKKNGHKHKPKNLKAKALPYGTWKCEECNLIFRTRADLYEHNHLVHPEYSKKSTWNKGLTKETSKIIELASKKVSASIKIAVLEGRCTGKAKTPELE